ncbi:MAG: ABC transporter permease subunit [Dehalococcoidia bacterium]
MSVAEGTAPRRGWRLRVSFQDPVVRHWTVEAVSLLVVVVAAVYLVQRVFAINLTFGFLGDPAGFGIGDQFLTRATGADPSWKAYLAGAANTVRVAFFAILIATGLGVLTGVSRLSSNWLISKVALGYVELVRNTPLLVFVVFWYTAVVLRLPPISRALHVGDLGFLSNRAIAFPTLAGEGGAALWWLLVAASTVGGIVAWRVLRRLEEERGRHYRSAWVGLAVALGGACLAYVALDGPVHVERPVLGRFSYDGGLQLSPEFAGLLLGVGVYRGAYVAEVVRGALLAVPYGEREAAASLGLNGGQQLSRIVLPQALRLIVPSMIAQCQVLVKSTAVAVAIAFPDMLSIGRTVATNSGQAEAMFFVILGSYLAMNLVLAWTLSLVRRRWLAARP